MLLKIIEESFDALPQYEQIPIAFLVETRFRVLPVENGLGGLQFVEEPVAPYIKDYDCFESERPAAWAARFNLSRWGMLSAFDGGRRIGGAVVAWRTPAVEMLEARADLACLWDLRVDPNYRKQGVGHGLFSGVAEWSRRRNCRQLKIETQNINVPACRFYARQGCKLGGVNFYAYEESLNEIQFLWYLDL